MNKMYNINLLRFQHDILLIGIISRGAATRDASTRRKSHVLPFHFDYRVLNRSYAIDRKSVLSAGV